MNNLKKAEAENSKNSIYTIRLSTMANEGVSGEIGCDGHQLQENNQTEKCSIVCETIGFRTFSRFYIEALIRSGLFPTSTMFVVGFLFAGTSLTLFTLQIVSMINLVPLSQFGSGFLVGFLNLLIAGLSFHSSK